MKVYFGSKLLSSGDTLGVAEANAGNITITNFASTTSELELINDGIDSILGYAGIRVSICRESYVYFNNMVTVEFIELVNPITISKEKMFFPPGNYRMVIHKSKYLFTIRPSGQNYLGFPHLMRLPPEILATVASFLFSDGKGMTIGEIWDLGIPNKNFCTPFFWRQLASIRLTKREEYLNENPRSDILNDLHYLDLHPLTQEDMDSLEDEGNRDKEYNYLEKFSRFELWRERYLDLGRFFYFIEMHLSMLDFPAITPDEAYEKYQSTQRVLALLFPEMEQTILENMEWNERNLWRISIYRQVMDNLTHKQYTTTLDYLMNNRKGISRYLISICILSEYIDPSFKTNLDDYPPYPFYTTEEEGEEDSDTD